MGKIKRKYTLGEEIFSSVSHGVGACLSIAGTVVLLVFSVIYGNALAVVSSAIYGAERFKNRRSDCIIHLQMKG
mgnify:CR=1 FL=1